MMVLWSSAERSKSSRRCFLMPPICRGELRISPHQPLPRIDHAQPLTFPSHTRPTREPRRRSTSLVERRAKGQTSSCGHVRHAPMYRLAIDTDPGGRVSTGWCRDDGVRPGRDCDRVAAVRTVNRVHERKVSRVLTTPSLVQSVEAPSSAQGPLHALKSDSNARLLDRSQRRPLTLLKGTQRLRAIGRLRSQISRLTTW